MPSVAIVSLIKTTMVLVACPAYRSDGVPVVIVIFPEGPRPMLSLSTILDGVS